MTVAPEVTTTDVAVKISTKFAALVVECFDR